MDTDPLAHDLVQHRDFLLRLAAGLVGRSDAEDLVQDVWTRALEHSPGPETGARAWLARVTRNLAVSRFRALDRRRLREREHADRRPDSDAGAVEEASERFELAQRLAAAVQGLEEPYRGVILLRFFEGLEPRDIAARLGVPLATVRTRQQRALVRLRERLDREPGGREAWLPGIAAWLGRHAASTPVPGGSGLLAGGVIAALAALGALGLWWFREEPTGALPSLAGEALGALVDGPGTWEQPSLSARAGERRPLEPRPASLARHLVVGRVLGPNAAECREVRVEVDAEWPYDIDPSALVGSVEEDGRFEVQVDELVRFDERVGPPREFVLRFDAPRRLLASARVAFEQGTLDEAGDTLFDCGEQTLAPAAVLLGVLRAPDGAPAAGAVVEAFPLEADGPREHSAGETVCDDEGRFDLRLECGGRYAVACLAQGVRPACRIDAAVLGEAHDLGLVLLEAGETISGRALRLGQPMPGAQIELSRREGRSLFRKSLPSLAWVDGGFEWERVLLQADEAGRFRCGGLRAAEYSLYVSRLSPADSSLSMRFEEARVLAPSANLPLEFRASRVTLKRAEGSPPEATGKIRVARDGKEEVALWFFSASNGPTSFSAPPNTPLSLSVEIEGLAPIPLELVTPGPGEELRRTIAFGVPTLDAALELELVPDARLERTGLRVFFESPEGVPRFERGFEAEELPASGRLRLEALPPGIQRVRVHAGWDRLPPTPAFDRVLEIELRSGETAHARVAFELGGLLRVDVRDPSGARRQARFRLLRAETDEQVPVMFFAHRDRSIFWEDWFLAPWSENESETLAVGDYEFVLWEDGFKEQRLPVRIAAGETTELQVTLRPK